MTERKSSHAPESAQAPESADARATKHLPLSRRLPDMSDYQLSAYQASARRIGGDPNHIKYASALKAIPMIETEIRRRADTARRSVDKSTT